MKVSCPFCESKYEIDDSLAGKKVECECGNKWLIEKIETPLKLTKEMKVMPETKKKNLQRQLYVAVAILMFCILAIIGICMDAEHMNSLLLKVLIAGTAIICLADITWLITLNNRLAKTIKKSDEQIQKESEEKKKQQGMAIGCLIILAVIFGFGMYACASSTSQDTIGRNIDSESSKDSRNEELARKIEYMAIEKVKAGMHNPKSFELANSKKEVNDNAVIIMMTFRGTNAFGAIVTQKALVIYDRHKDELSVVVE